MRKGPYPHLLNVVSKTCHFCGIDEDAMAAERKRKEFVWCPARASGNPPVTGNWGALLLRQPAVTPPTEAERFAAALDVEYQKRFGSDV